MGDPHKKYAVQRPLFQEDRPSFMESSRAAQGRESGNQRFAHLVAKVRNRQIQFSYESSSFKRLAMSNIPVVGVTGADSCGAAGDGTWYRS